MDKKKEFLKIKVERSVSSPVFSEVKSHLWKHFLRDKKRGLAKCKVCESVLKCKNTTSVLNKHLKIHKIEAKPVENLEELPSKKGKIENLFCTKIKATRIARISCKNDICGWNILCCYSQK